jgi:hypothetical protein
LAANEINLDAPSHPPSLDNPDTTDRHLILREARRNSCTCKLAPYGDHEDFHPQTSFLLAGTAYLDSHYLHLADRPRLTKVTKYCPAYRNHQVPQYYLVAETDQVPVQDYNGKIQLGKDRLLEDMGMFLASQTDR